MKALTPRSVSLPWGARAGLAAASGIPADLEVEPFGKSETELNFRAEPKFQDRLIRLLMPYIYTALHGL